MPEEIKKYKVEKLVKGDYKVLDKNVNKVEIKFLKKDSNSVEYYVYDLFDENRICIALNRYVLIDNLVEQPFDKLTEEEILILNPVIEKQEEILEI